MKVLPGIFLQLILKHCLGRSSTWHQNLPALARAVRTPIQVGPKVQLFQYSICSSGQKPVLGEKWEQDKHVCMTLPLPLPPAPNTSPLQPLSTVKENDINYYINFLKVNWKNYIVSPFAKCIDTYFPSPLPPIPEWVEYVIWQVSA